MGGWIGRFVEVDDSISYVIFDGSLQRRETFDGRDERGQLLGRSDSRSIRRLVQVFHLALEVGLLFLPEGMGV